MNLTYFIRYKFSKCIFHIDDLPVEYDGFLLRFGVCHLHVAYQQPINRGAIFVQVYFHLQRRAGVDVEFTVNDTTALAHAHLEHGNWRVFRQRSSDLQVPIMQFNLDHKIICTRYREKHQSPIIHYFLIMLRYKNIYYFRRGFKCIVYKSYILKR